jgi:hypothetical protein
VSSNTTYPKDVHRPSPRLVLRSQQQADHRRPRRLPRRLLLAMATLY